MRVFFKRYGTVKDLYVPNKLLKNGKPFGFVRFEGIKDVNHLLIRLNTIYLNGNWLRAYKAFDRNNSSNVKQTNQRNPHPQPQNPPATQEQEPKIRTQYVPKTQTNNNTNPTHSNAFRDNRSFNEVIDSSRNLPNTLDKPRVICIDEEETNKDVLKYAIMGEIIDIDLIEQFPTLCVAEGLTKFNIKYLGGLDLCLIFDNEETVTNILNTQDHILRNWLKNIRRIEDKCFQTSRLTWLNIKGVPISCWSEKNFKKIAGWYGPTYDFHNCSFNDGRGRYLSSQSDPNYNSDHQLEDELSENESDYEDEPLSPPVEALPKFTGSDDSSRYFATSADHFSTNIDLENTQKINDSNNYVNDTAELISNTESNGTIPQKSKIDDSNILERHQHLEEISSINDSGKLPKTDNQKISPECVNPTGPNIRLPSPIANPASLPQDPISPTHLNPIDLSPLSSPKANPTPVVHTEPSFNHPSLSIQIPQVEKNDDPLGLSNSCFNLNSPLPSEGMNNSNPVFAFKSKPSNNRYNQSVNRNVKVSACKKVKKNAEEVSHKKRKRYEGQTASSSSNLLWSNIRKWNGSSKLRYAKAQARLPSKKRDTKPISNSNICSKKRLLSLYQITPLV
ncbi:uncharacterized protein [Rutidosis leptorrhynchoides]|uniref:uncharacterized protein n=1 Tax=Rutidosis leptorrhynchoides TaxID=125765 RepID=UPI003A9963C0